MKTIYKASRSWGFEYLIHTCLSRYTIKILHILEGKCGGLQFHRFKDECGLVLEGKLNVSIAFENHISKRYLSKGDFFHFPPGQIHQESAIEDTYILEISTPHFNDRVRYDSDVNSDNALQTTLAKDVVELCFQKDLLLLEQLGFLPCSPDKVKHLNAIKHFLD